MTIRQRTTKVQPKKRTSEGTERSSDTPEHGDVPMPKFWQPCFKPRPTYRNYAPWPGFTSPIIQSQS
eukprot:12345-Lingulodinium_polyedra.AAC.1